MAARPKSAAPSYNWKERYGQMSMPAGVPGMFGQRVSLATYDYGAQLSAVMGLQEHALKRYTPYAKTASVGWTAPGKEPSIKPKASQTGAGVVSAGSIDNTYLPKPLTNAWGKARERFENEIEKAPHKQATDLLTVAKGAHMPMPRHTMSDMTSVRPLYSKTIPGFHMIDPLRVDSGFIRGPNIIPGAAPPPQSAMIGVRDTPTVPPNHRDLKIAFDQSMDTGRIPVSKVVRGMNVKSRPNSAAPMFLTKPAGLPGGLSLIQTDA